jgi:hypothetical protein
MVLLNNSDKYDPSCLVIPVINAIFDILIYKVFCIYILIFN